MTEMKRSLRAPDLIFASIAAILTALGRSVDYGTLSGLTERENIMVDRDPLAALLIALAVLIGILHVRRLSRKRQPAVTVFAVLFGFLSVCAQSLYYFDSFEFLTKGAYQAALSLVCMFGYAILYWLAARLLLAALEGGLPCRARVQARQTPFTRFIEQHVRLSVFLLIVLCWLPWIAAFYPGVVTWDMFGQLKAFFGTLPLMDDHPVVSTALMGLCMRIGLFLGSGNPGAFLYMLLQTAVCAYAFAVSVDEMGRLGCSKRAQMIAALFFALVPIWPMYARMGHKDFLFTGVCLLFTVDVTRAALRREEAFTRPTDFVRFGVLALLTCLLRKNGIAVVLPSALCTVLFAFKGRRRFHALSALGGAVALYAAVQLMLLPALGIAKSSSRELFSIPFQQTARYLRANAGDVPTEQRAAVNAVLDADAIAAAYVPVLSDPVKATFRPGADKEALRGYLSAWGRMGLDDPTTYFAATLSGNYGYYLFTPRIWYNDSTGPCFWYDWEIIPTAWIEEFGLSLPDALTNARGVFRTIAEGFEDVPLLGMLYQNALYAFLTWLAAYSIVRRRRGSAWIAAVPSLCTFLICFGMPVNACLRYFLPVVASCPLLLAAAAHTGRREDPVRID